MLTYNRLMDSGWKMRDIDEMDFLGFLRVRAWQAAHDAKQKAPRQAYIDEVWPTTDSFRH